ncbi:LysE family translocator [Celerinatantimonas sp. YJH-8]|uniref:LysE family translocator n=1 Tax=Celerinatantimonas sp. YJH-8 TaxID=3228714 RepID=UPI0038C26BA7
MTIQMAMAGSYKASICTVLGIVTGTCIWASLGYAGVTFVFQWVSVLYEALKILGGLYLCYLGIKLFFSQKKQAISVPQVAQISLPGCFLKGLLTNLLNPKTAIFITSLFAAAIPIHHSWSVGLVSVVLMCAISLSWYVLVATLFSGQSIKSYYELYRGVVEKIAGGLFVLLGLKLAFTK